MTDVAATTVTEMQVSSDGETVRLRFVDAAGQAGSLALPVGGLATLLARLLRLATEALRLKHRDPSLRIACPLARFRLESAAGSSSLLLTLAACDGSR